MTKKEKAAAAAMTREQIGQIVGDMAEKNVQLAVLLARKNARIDAIRSEFEDLENRLTQALAGSEEVVKHWASVHKDEPNQFGENRSIEFARGRIGWRLGKHAVRAAAGMTLKEVVKRLLGLDWGKQFVRNDPELAKDVIIQNRQSLTAEQLTAAGIVIEQEDHFFIETKADQPVEAAPASCN